MATKVVYFTIAENDEQAEFRSDDSIDDVREIFRVAAEAGYHDILKLYNTKGSLINISPKLGENTPDSRYKLDVVAAQFSGSSAAAELGVDIATLDERLQKLEHKILVEGGEIPKSVDDMKNKVENLRQRLESVDHLSWLGLYKDLSSGTSLQPFWNKQNNSGKKSVDHCRRIYDKFLKMSLVQVTDEVRDYLKKPSFDNWQWDDSEMMILIRQMYIDLGFISKFNIEMPVLHKWLYQIYRHYNNVPFHNFKHCFMVTQMMYGLTWLIGLQNILEPLDVLILLTSAVCHDLDHPGYNNAYQINARTELALRYNDISPLENHHCSVAFEILEQHDCNIFRNLPMEQFKCVREGMIKTILATDMTKHNEIVKSFKSIVNCFDPTNRQHKEMLLMILMKTADISNEARPMQVAEPWLECLLEEYFGQSDMEKLEGLPVAPFMDREKVTKPSSQIGFIKFVLLPLFEALGELFPVITNDIIVPVRQALAYYTDMQQALEEEKKRKEKEISNKLENNKRKTSEGMKTNPSSASSTKSKTTRPK